VVSDDTDEDEPNPQDPPTQSQVDFLKAELKKYKWILTIAQNDRDNAVLALGESEAEVQDLIQELAKQRATVTKLRESLALTPQVVYLARV